MSTDTAFSVGRQEDDTSCRMCQDVPDLFGMLPDYFAVLCACLSRDRNPRIPIPAVTTLDHCIEDFVGAKFSPRFLRGGAKFSPCRILPREKVPVQFFPLPGT